jgi:hypothetical protein
MHPCWQQLATVQPGGQIRGRISAIASKHGVINVIDGNLAVIFFAEDAELFIVPCSHPLTGGKFSEAALCYCSLSITLYRCSGLASRVS